MKELTLLIVTLVGVVISLIMVPSFIARSKIRDRYCWLNLLNNNSWKSSRELANEAEIKANAKFVKSIIYQDLEDLENEGLVVSREILSNSFLFEYKLTENGLRKKINMDQTMRAFQICESNT